MRIRRKIGLGAALLLAGVTVIGSGEITQAAGTLPAPPTSGQLATAKATFEKMVGAPAQYVTGSVQSYSVAVHGAKDVASGLLLPRLKADPPGAAKANSVAAVLYKQLPSYETVVAWSTTPPTGTKYELLPGGSVVVVGADLNGNGIAWETRDVQAAFAKPQARDATGQDLETWYEIRNGQLYQHVITLGAIYPVVVDPSITGYGWFGLSTQVVYIQWSLSQTRSLYSSGAGGGWTDAAFVACGGIPNLAAKAACAYIVRDRVDDFKAALTLAHDRDDCLKARVPTTAFPLPAEAINALDFYVKTC